MRFPEVHIDRATGSLLAPKLISLKPNGIEVNAFVAPMRVGIRKDMDAVTEFDGARMIAGVARRARVSEGILIDDTNLVAG